MAFLLQTDRVLYQCSCGSRFPLCRLYFCRYCISLRCASCTQHEADVFYCPQCLQSHMAPEAKLNHMRCRNCYDCPSCGALVTLKQAAATVAADGSSAAVKKKFYLMCGYCHWTSRDSHLDDREQAAMQEGFSSSEVHIKEVSGIKALQEAYQLINLRDASERAVKKAGTGHIRRKNMAALGTLRDEMAPLMSVKLIPGSTITPSRMKLAAQASPAALLCDIKSTSSETIEPLTDDFYTQEVNIQSATTVSQRYLDAQSQPESSELFRPIRKKLAIKKSIRCKQCDHSLCKPEFSTSTIKFKIQLLAQLQLPELRIHPAYKLHYGKDCQVVLSVSNPDQLQACKFSLVADNDNSHSSLPIKVPEMVEFELDPKNEAFSLDDSLETEPDKEQYLAYNHGSKIGIRCTVTVPDSAVSNTTVCLLMMHTPLISSNESERKSLTFPITVELDQITS